MTRTDPFGRIRQALLSVFSAPADQRDTTEQLPIDDELEVGFAEVEADLRSSRDLLVYERLLLALHRRCPVTAVRASPVEGTGRVCFANGTTVIAETRPFGRLSVLAVAVLRGRRVLLEGVEFAGNGNGVEMRFSLPDRSTFVAYAIGLDQED